MSTKIEHEIPQNPVILRCHRIMEAFAKSDDEKDFYLDRVEGFLIYVDLDRSEDEINELMSELGNNPNRYVPIPKLTFYEIKKLMEGFVNEKIYDIDTKDKLLDIIQSREARDTFLEFIYDHHTEMERWQQYYQERFRVRIIEWLRNHTFDFVFEEDIEFTKSLLERVKLHMFTSKASKDILQARKILTEKAATYYLSEALNPRPKRGRPPKQIIKVEIEPQFSQDIYVAVPRGIKPFLFTPDYHSSSMVFTFSGKFNSEADLLAFRRQQIENTLAIESVDQKFAVLRSLSGFRQDEEQENALKYPHLSPSSLNTVEPKAKKKKIATKKEGSTVELQISDQKKSAFTNKKSFKSALPGKKLKQSVAPPTSPTKQINKTSQKKSAFDREVPQVKTKTKTASRTNKQSKAQPSPLKSTIDKKTSTIASTKKSAPLQSSTKSKPSSQQKIRLRPLIRKGQKKP